MGNFFSVRTKAFENLDRALQHDISQNRNILSYFTKVIPMITYTCVYIMYTSCNSDTLSKALRNYIRCVSRTSIAVEGHSLAQNTGSRALCRDASCPLDL